MTLELPYGPEAAMTSRKRAKHMAAPITPNSLYQKILLASEGASTHGTPARQHPPAAAPSGGQAGLIDKRVPGGIEIEQAVELGLPALQWPSCSNAGADVFECLAVSAQPSRSRCCD